MTKNYFVQPVLIIFGRNFKCASESFYINQITKTQGTVVTAGLWFLSGETLLQEKKLHWS